MKKYFLFLMVFFLILPRITHGQSMQERLSGKFLLQTEETGQVWYVSPYDYKRYEIKYSDSINTLSKLAVGISDKNLKSIPIDIEFVSKNLDSDSDGFTDYEEVFNGFDPYGNDVILINENFSSSVKGRMYLQVEDKGQLWYVNSNAKRVEITARNIDTVIKKYMLGITNANLSNLRIGSIDNFSYKKEKINEYTNKINLDVPFYSQAPTGNWSDERQRFGCEEAAVLMVMKWIDNKVLTKEETENYITSISDYEQKYFGNFYDTSIQDTYNNIVRGYFQYDSAFIEKNISLENILDNLNKGNAIIIPINGRIFNNPHYKGQGPFEHVLVVKGYDPVKNVFIVHDPGTSYGANYEVSAEHLNKSLQDYTSGKMTNKALDTVSMIVFSKN